MSSSNRPLRGMLRMTRLRLAVFVALSAATGHGLAAGGLTWAMLVPAVACLLLAAGASALNQVQERDLDRRMLRTRERPLAAGRIRLGHAVTGGLGLAVCGLGTLFLFGGTLAGLLGVSALLIYNGFYTWLKRHSPFAAVPGALVGSLGPAIGWFSAGGPLGSPALLAVMVIFYLWQVPHFWLLMLRHREDYRSTGLPAACSVLRAAQLNRVIFVWIAATASAVLLAPLFGLLQRREPYFALCAACVALAVVCVGLLRAERASDRQLRWSFTGLNLFVLATMIFLLVDRELRP